MKEMLELGPAILPIASFLLTGLYLLGRASSPPYRRPADWRDSFITSAILWGAVVTVTAEALGTFGVLHRGWLIRIWLTIAVGAGVAGFRTGHLQRGLHMLRQSTRGLERTEKLVLGAIAAALGLLLMVAWISPTNNLDSLLYHMTRVANWAQNGSLRHYSASYLNQLIMPIWAEVAVLQLRLLSGSEQISNLIQWFSMAGSLAVVSAIAGRLGINRRGQIFTAALAAGIPMGILQATSTQNDYVVGFWLACIAYILLSPEPGAPTSRDFLLFGLALGLALLTKATAYIYAAPLVIWFAISSFRNRRPRAALAGTLGIAVLAVALNAGYWGRNLATFGGPFGPVDTIQDTVGIFSLGSLEPRPENEAAVVATFRVGASRVGKALARNLITPLASLNERLRSFAATAFGDGGPDFKHEMSVALWNHEDTAGNLLHLALLMVTALGILIAGRSKRIRVPVSVWAYGGSVLAGLFLLTSLVSHASTPYGVRFQLPFFLLWTPLAGFVLTRFNWRRSSELVVAGVLFASLPWLLFNNTRPVIGRQPWTTRVDSVLVAPPEEIMFAMAPALRESAQVIAETIARSGCRAVGLRVDSSDPSYLFWWVLGAPESGVHLETIYTYDSLERYLDSSFEPCAVVCTICQNRALIGNLPLTGEFGSVRLYGP